VLFGASLAGLIDLHFTLVAGLIFAVSLLVLLTAGLLWPAGEPAPGSVWSRSMARPERPGAWWADYRIQSVGLLLLTTLSVWAFV
jgi:SSS family solute:Na+ symporter